jgi:hypothetical protein
MFYVYEHWRPDKDQPFYVGKGRGGRANLMARRNQYHKAIQAKLHREGFAVEVKIIAVNLTEEEAFALEIERIAMWNEMGIELANMTIGGEGPAGRIGLKGEKNPMYGKKSFWAGKNLPEETRIKISKAGKGKQKRLGAVLCEETKRKIGEANKGPNLKLRGRPKSEEHKRKISETISKVIVGENNPFYGKKHTEETKRKISMTKKAKSCPTAP